MYVQLGGKCMEGDQEHDLKKRYLAQLGYNFRDE
jgi:hypothetical protein